MMRLRTGTIRGLVAICLLLTGLYSHANDTPLSGIEAFAQEPAMSRAMVSPDGKHLATLQRFAKDGKQFLLIYETDKMGVQPVTLGSSKMNISSFRWVNDERLVVVFQQDVDTLQKFGVDTRLVSKLATIDVKGKRWLEIPRKRADRRSEFARINENFGGASIFSMMPHDKKHILIKYDDDQNGVAGIFKVNVKTGTAQLVARDSSKISITHLDKDGEPRLATSFDDASSAQIYLARLKGSKKWLEVGRTEATMADMVSQFQILRPVEDGSNEVWVISRHEFDTNAVYIFNLETKEFGEAQFRHPQYDAVDVRTTLDDDKNPQVVGFTYWGKRVETFFIDPEEKARYDAINQILPGNYNSIVSRSDDEKIMVIQSVGPRKPNTWYLLKDNRLELLGKSMPFLTEEMLSRVEWTRYKARDGLSIPALVTIPDGEGPFPVVIHPHGGPVARDSWGFDLWAQLLAYHGYLVVQPQFRISEGLGKKHLTAGFGRWGHEMQDDLDDAITHFAERGLADPKRAAIFGWSYGGYAAFVGSFRDPNPYQCAVAGAGVADVPYFRAWLADFGTATEKTYRKTVDGVNPLDHVDSVDIPILVVHGDIDERVPVQESRKFVKKLQEYNKQHRYIELEGANHFFGTIFYRHWMEMFPALVDWLDNTCGLQTASAG